MQRNSIRFSLIQVINVNTYLYLLKCCFFLFFIFNMKWAFSVPFSLNTNVWMHNNALWIGKVCIFKAQILGFIACSSCRIAYWNIHVKLFYQLLLLSRFDFCFLLCSSSQNIRYLSDSNFFHATHAKQIKSNEMQLEMKNK